jgi:hypothetical protein
MKNGADFVQDGCEEEGGDDKIFEYCYCGMKG